MTAPNAMSKKAASEFVGEFDDWYRKTLADVDLNDPRWADAGRVHDWRNHIHSRIQAIWDTFTAEQRAALVMVAIEAAYDEVLE